MIYHLLWEYARPIVRRVVVAYILLWICYEVKSKSKVRLDYSALQSLA